MINIDNIPESGMLAVVNAAGEDACGGSLKKGTVVTVKKAASNFTRPYLYATALSTSKSIGLFIAEEFDECEYGDYCEDISHTYSDAITVRALLLRIGNGSVTLDDLIRIV